MSALTIPNSFVTGTVIQAAPFNGNFSAIQTWSTSIDNTNLTGGAGIFASQIVPTSTAQATVGGTFGLLAIASGATAGQLPPVYTNGGASLGPTTRIVTGQATVQITLATNSGGTAVAFTGSSQFTSGSSYYVLLSPNALYGGNWGNGNVVVLLYPTLQASTGFTVSMLSTSSIGAVTQFLVINYICIGT